MADPDQRACPACGGRLERWRSAPAAEPGPQTRIGMRRCRSCGTAVTDAPLPREDPHTAGAYATAWPRLAGIAAPLLAAFDAQRLRILRHALGPAGRGAQAVPELLDVGAGRGRFVSSARRAGFRAQGIEPTDRGVLAARALGVELIQRRVEDVRWPEGSLDAVTAWHVLEHLEDPAGALAAMRSWLAPRGVMLVGVPNLESLQARLTGERWYHLDLPRHRTHFTAGGLGKLMAAQGLTPLAVHHVLLEHNPFGMWQSLVNRMTTTPSYLYNLLKRNAPLSGRDLLITALAAPAAPAAAVLELAAGLCRRGGTIALTARRS